MTVERGRLGKQFMEDKALKDKVWPIFVREKNLTVLNVLKPPCLGRYCFQLQALPYGSVFGNASKSQISNSMIRLKYCRKCMICSDQLW